MKKLKVFFISFFLIINSPLFAYSSDPKEFVKELLGDVISKLSSKDLSDEEKKDYIKVIALENVDIKALSLYTLGEIRKSANKNDLAQYQDIFEKYFLKSLTSRLTDYSSSSFKVESFEKK